MEPTDLVTQRAQARVGALLNGRWRLNKLVGVGGMAAVYAATHRNTKRVAIKILHPEISVDENARQRFLMEGYAANQVGHRGAVAADDDGLTEDGVAFLVMELLEGETLEERGIRKGGKLLDREVLALMDQALSTLEAALCSLMTVIPVVTTVAALLIARAPLQTFSVSGTVTWVTRYLNASLTTQACQTGP